MRRRAPLWNPVEGQQYEAVTVGNVMVKIYRRERKTVKDKMRWVYEVTDYTNGLRHSFISYRLADIQNTAHVALEAGNSPAMVFKHYRELVKPEQARQWFGVTP